MTFEITPTISQELDWDWSENENYVTEAKERRGRAREGTRAQNHTKKISYFSDAMSE